MSMFEHDHNGMNNEKGMNNSNRRYGKHFSLIVVLFILLIIVGASYYC